LPLRANCFVGNVYSTSVEKVFENIDSIGVGGNKGILPQGGLAMTGGGGGEWGEGGVGGRGRGVSKYRYATQVRCMEGGGEL
jgi:hypothetical protein